MNKLFFIILLTAVSSCCIKNHKSVVPINTNINYDFIYTDSIIKPDYKIVYKNDSTFIYYMDSLYYTKIIKY